MTLEDFFTLTEINNGLTVPSRVEELVAIMQKERDYIVKNTGDATRQWSAVAKALSATENKDCLDLFIQLDGLQFIAKWLKDVKFNTKSSDTLLEESISLLLQALEKLNLDYEKVSVSEIWAAVEDLVHNSCSKVQDKARALFESWKRKRDGDTSLLLVENKKVGNGADIERDGECSLSNEISDKEKDQKLTENDPVISLRVDVVHTGQVENALNSVKNDESLDLTDSPSLKKPAMEPTSLESCSPVVSRQDTLDGETGIHEFVSASDTKRGPESESSQKQLGLLGEVDVSQEKLLTSGSDAADIMKSATKPDSQIFSLTEDKSFGTRKIDSGENSALDGNQCKSSSAFTAKESGEFNSRMLCKSSSNEKVWGKVKNLGAFLSGSESDGKINSLDRHVFDDASKNDHNFSKKETDKNSDIELDYGIVDPLEVARQVAIEVERDHRERSCSSSEKLPEDNVHSPESKSHTSVGPPDDVADEPDSSQEESMTSSEKPEAEQTNETQEIETSQVTEMAREEEPNTEKNPCNFDLNEEICSEDHTDGTANQNSTPVSIVSASRAAAAPGQPIAPLQFEGELGWKGSAATSAFRPASSRRVPQIDKDRSNLDFDLNVAENVDPSESSVELSSRKSERLELDLNLVSQDGGPPPHWQMSELFPHSSSSSSKQISQRDFNLNHQPSSDNSYLSKMPQIYNGVKPDEAVISIMGRRVEVNRKDSVPTLPLPNGRNPELGFDVNLVRPGGFLGIGPMMMPYSHSPVYGYNNVTPGPAMPYASAMYGSGGPIPYMVDSRGAPVIPQIVGGPSSSMPTAFSQHPFFVNMTNSNGVGPVGPVGPSRSSFDLNSGMMVGNGSRDPSGFSQFLNSGQLRSMDEQLKSNSQPSISSVVGVKRKEPDNGWENYPFKHHTPPPWK